MGRPGDGKRNILWDGLRGDLHSKPERSARIRRNLSPSIFCLLKKVLRKKKNEGEDVTI